MTNHDLASGQPASRPARQRAGQPDRGQTQRRTDGRTERRAGRGDGRDGAGQDGTEWDRTGRDRTVMVRHEFVFDICVLLFVFEKHDFKNKTLDLTLTNHD